MTLKAPPYNFVARTLVYNRANGETDIVPFGTERDTSVDGYTWITHSIIPAVTVEER